MDFSEKLEIQKEALTQERIRRQKELDEEFDQKIEALFGNEGLIEKLIKDEQEKEKGLNYGDALSKVGLEHPELFPEDE